MKPLILILLLCLINSFLAQTENDICSSGYRNILKTSCESILPGICKYNEGISSRCITTKKCENGHNINQQYCEAIIPVEYDKKKCEWDPEKKECNLVPRTCSDYRRIGNVNGNYENDDCESLSSPNENIGNGCAIDSNGQCRPYFKQCSNIISSTYCTASNIPTDKTKKCIWDEITDPSNPICRSETRFCNEYSYLGIGWANKENCHLLKATNFEKECIYNKGICQEEYSECSKYDGDEDTCITKMPLTPAKNEFDFSKKCIYTSDNKCIEVNRKCLEYNEYSPYYDDPQRCIELSASDNKKQCYYDNDDIDGNKCKEQYKTCELYDQNVGLFDKPKTRDECEKIRITNDKCIYIEKENKCQLKSTTYLNCGEYLGSDKKICENILSQKTNSYCILHKDKTCKEREFFCDEAQNKYDCLIYAKPLNDKYKCVFDPRSNICYEQYKGCEDIVENLGDFCSNNLYTYNGEKCFIESDKCKSKNKKCEEALDEEECKLIEKTGVFNSELKICDWLTISSIKKCWENYKYCSDYRGNNAEICSRIKPYNDKGDELDIGYKCQIRDPKVGCEKIPKDCADAGNNPILCSLISPNIRNNNKMYCAFISGQCADHYKTCEDYDDDPLDETICKYITVQENHLSIKCEKLFNATADKYQCISRKICDAYTLYDHQYLCQNIDPSCTYNNGYCYQENNKKCNDIIFYTEDKADENFCKSIKTTDVDKICVLKKDKSGCEEVYKESYHIYYALNKKGENSNFALSEEGVTILKIILLGLLF